MKRKFWNALWVAAPVTLILPGFSFSQIPKFFESLEFKSFLSQVVTQIAVGVTDALIDVAVRAAFGLV